MTKYKPLLICLSLCVGLILGLYFNYFGFRLSLLSILVASLMCTILLKRNGLVLILVFLIGFNLSGIRANKVIEDIEIGKNLIGQELLLKGLVIEDPNYHKSGQKQFHISSVEIHEPISMDMSGSIRIRSFEADNIYRGDKISVSGKMFPALGNRHGTIQYASISIESKSHSFLENFRRSFFAEVYSTVPDPESSLGLGFLVGVGNLLPKELNENLRATGLTHIVAVSGYNLTVLVFLTRRAFSRYSKYLATISAIALVLVFLSLTGGAPSIVRASIVSFLSLWAWFYGRKVNPIVLIVVAASISATISPYYIWKDIGWYLSFSAFFGVLVLAPQIAKRYFKKKPGIVKQLLLETSCAQIMTIPIAALIFGNVSTVSLLANLIVLPLIPLSMTTTFISGAVSMINTQFAQVFLIPTRYILTFIVDIADILGRYSFALAEIKMNAIAAISIYTLILVVTLHLYLKNRSKSDDFDIDGLY